MHQNLLNLSWHCSPESQEAAVPCADAKPCWQQGQQLWQHSCARDPCRYLVYHWCLLRCIFESRQQVLETKGKVKRQPSECFSAYGYRGKDGLWIWACLFLHQLRYTSGNTHIPEFPIPLPSSAKKRVYILYCLTIILITRFSHWVGFTTILIQAGGNEVSLAIRFCKVRCGHCFPDAVLGVCDQPHHLLGEEAGWQAGGLIKDGLTTREAQQEQVQCPAPQKGTTPCKSICWGWPKRGFPARNNSAFQIMWA